MMIEKVIEFNKMVLNIPQREIADLSPEEFAITHKSLLEEVQEFYEAETITDSVDALIDTIYFALGALYKHGLNAAEVNAIFSAVHEANMQKIFGFNNKRHTGAADAVKPDGWIDPKTVIQKIVGEA